MPAFSDLPGYFSGDWAFDRTVFSANAETPYAYGKGAARFIPRNHSELDYNESGKFHLTSFGTDIEFTRSFRFCFIEDRMNVYFADGPSDGQIYQLYKPNGKFLDCAAPHLCRLDRYESAYKLEENAFSMKTTIKGPQKNYFIETSFYRILGRVKALIP